jgi:drug/metabolite transporter (DMT)-like permease
METSKQDARQGLLNGLLGVIIFSATIPATRLAVGELSAGLLAFARAAIAGLLAWAWLRQQGYGGVENADRPALLRASFGVVFGFPLFSSLAMQSIPASHGAIVNGLLPLATAIAGAWIAKERLRLGFWLAAAFGSALVLAFALRNGAGQLQAGDAFMVLAVVCGAIGYAEGGRLSKKYGGPRVICSALLVALPLAVPASLLLAWLQHAKGSGLQNVSWQSWCGLAYVSVFSMWLGFFYWYKGLAQGGVAKVGQVQLLQPFLTIVFASLLLKEPFDAITVSFALAVIATIAIGRRFG